MDPAELAVRRWLSTFVVRMNLCPFARQALVQSRIRFACTAAENPGSLLLALRDELDLLHADERVETTLLIHPQVLHDFHDYNDFLDDADALLLDSGYEGVFQIASFHPNFQYAGTAPGDPENYANRAPHPLLHLLRESSVASAAAEHPNIERVPERNIRFLNELGVVELARLWEGCCRGEISPH